MARSIVPIDTAWCRSNQRTSRTSTYATEKSHNISGHRLLADTEIDDVSGAVTASLPAYIHMVFSSSASDLVLPHKGFVAEAAYDAAKSYIRGQ